MTGHDLPVSSWGPPDDSRRPENDRRLTASFDLMTAVLNGAALPRLLILVAEQARAMAGVPLAFIALPCEENHTLRIDIAVGAGSDRIRGLTVRRGKSMLGRAFGSRRPVSARIAADQTLSTLPAGPILILPLDTGEAARGVLAVVGQPGAQPFSPATARQLMLFADTSARLVQLAEDRRTTAPSDRAAAHVLAQRPPQPPHL
ncbi:histidine kinase [Mycobacterium tuberculosis]|jgi:hypothetical protein|nr:histidine kinase [Mycobacterium tuberculosis]